MTGRVATVTLVSNSPDETEALGYRLGILARRIGVRAILLYGDLGAGKTTLVKGVARSVGIAAAEVCSASFVIVAEYETSPPFYHIDLYRLERAEHVDEAGIWEYFDGDGLAVVEWAERLGEEPDSVVKLRLGYAGESRREIVIEGEGVDAL